MKEQQDYWNGFIIKWDDSTYNASKKGLNFIEKIATSFRGTLRFRHHFAVSSLSPHARGKNILEIGCGTGRLTLALLASDANRINAYDISPAAVEATKKRLSENGIPPENYSVTRADVSETDIDKDSFELAIGLGILEYFDEAEFDRLLALLSGKDIFFEFHERIYTPMNICHKIYRGMKRYLTGQVPPYIMYSRDELRDLLKAKWDKPIYYHRSNDQSFITTLQCKNADWEAL